VCYHDTSLVRTRDCEKVCRVGDRAILSHDKVPLDLARAIENATGKKALLEDTRGPPGDVRETYADISRAARDFGFTPKVSLGEGIARFVEWYRRFYAV
jgi:UDP-glucuronate 4-epimerase